MYAQISDGVAGVVKKVMVKVTLSAKQEYVGPRWLILGVSDHTNIV